MKNPAQRKLLAKLFVIILGIVFAYFYTRPSLTQFFLLSLVVAGIGILWLYDGTLRQGERLSSKATMHWLADGNALRIALYGVALFLVGCALVGLSGLAISNSWSVTTMLVLFLGGYLVGLAGIVLISYRFLKWWLRYISNAFKKYSDRMK